MYKEDLYIYIYTHTHTESCLNIYVIHVTTNKSTTNNNVLFFCFRFENSTYYNIY